MCEAEEEREIGKKEVEERERWQEELSDLINWKKYIVPSGEKADLLLFNINNNLKRIADSLDAIFLKL